MPKSVVVFSILLVMALIVGPAVFPAIVHAGSGSCGGSTLASRTFVGTDAGVRASLWATGKMQTLVGDCDSRWVWLSDWVVTVYILGS